LDQFAAQGMEASAALQRAVATVAATVHREAFVMAYSDCFFLLGALLLAAISCVWFCRPVRGGASGLH
jgi:DHA2 family multidrug resistance protein